MALSVPDGNYYTIGNNGSIEIYIDDNEEIVVEFTEVLLNNDNILDGIYDVNTPFIATACFTAGAIVETDQGNIPIEMITRKHKICKKEIKGVSKTIYSQNRVIKIEKNAFGKNKPSQKTIVAPYHKFMINGKLDMICNSVNNETIYYTKYRQEPLYNIIMEKPDLMKVNNMIVETMNPSNLIAKVFDGSLSKEKRKKVIRSINEHHKRIRNLKKIEKKNYQI
jgi:hypothetical protein